jgi:hypothetical protein
MSGIVEIAVIAAAAGYVVVTQVRGQSLHAKRLVLLPAVVLVIGLAGLHGMTGVSSADVACITASALIAAAIGCAQGRMTQLQSRDGALWGRLPARGLWLWAALVISRVAMMAVAHGIGAEAAASLDSVLVVLGVNRLAQAGMIASRATRAGLPLAP